MKMRTTPQLEARLVAGMFNRNKKAQSELYAYCSRYFWASYRGIFFADEETATEIFQNTFIAFWENIERRKIYASEDRVMGKNDEPLSAASLLTLWELHESNTWNGLENILLTLTQKRKWDEK